MKAFFIFGAIVLLSVPTVQAQVQAQSVDSLNTPENAKKHPIYVLSPRQSRELRENMVRRQTGFELTDTIQTDRGPAPLRVLVNCQEPSIQVSFSEYRGRRNQFGEHYSGLFIYSGSIWYQRSQSLTRNLPYGTEPSQQDLDMYYTTVCG